MLSSIPLVGALIAKLLCWPIQVALTAPAEVVVQTVKTTCNFLLSPGCAP